MPESERGCGYRKIGGLYLASDLGVQIACDALPLPLDPCGCCGFEPFPTRGLQRLKANYIQFLSDRKHKDMGIAECQDDAGCPVCYPWGNADRECDSLNLGLMFVGGSYYTPKSFIEESLKLGVSKRIPEIPAWLILGKTWILLAHKEVPLVDGVPVYELKGMAMQEPETKAVVFYAFKPQRVEVPLWKGSVTDEEIMLMERHGVTPVLLDPSEENRKVHKDAKVNIRVLFERWREQEAEEAKKLAKAKLSKKPKEPVPDSTKEIERAAKAAEESSK